MINLAVLTASALVLFVVVEVVLRTTHLFNARLAFTQPDPVISWRFTPGREYWSKHENDHAIIGRINSYGWRDRERTLVKPEGVFRVAVVGDSFVEAMQVELDSTFIAIAERALDRTGRPVEILNFGRSGTTVTEERLIIESDVLRFDPDLVVLCFLPRNDIDDVNPATAFIPMRPYYRVDRDGELVLDTSFNTSGAYRRKVFINSFKQRSALISLMTARLNIWQRARRMHGLGATRDAPSIREEFTLCTATPDPVFASNYTLCKRILADANRVCVDDGVPLLLMCLPDVYQPERVSELKQLDPTYNENFFEDDLSAWCDSTGIDFAGMNRYFAQHYAAHRERLQWTHWNYAGHRVAAEVLERAIRRYTE